MGGGRKGGRGKEIFLFASFLYLACATEEQKCAKESPTFCADIAKFPSEFKYDKHGNMETYKSRTIGGRGDFSSRDPISESKRSGKESLFVCNVP